ncbi:MAG: 3-deoxy-8-phosphooctulonate synthase [Phycisphaerales bacterium]|nr:3-deoxy-8-phosphooctulonate synthase [Phycisphaerales bacterium]
MSPIPIGSLTWNPLATDSTGFLLIAGPCVIESLQLCLDIGGTVQDTCRKLGIPYVFKASFDKANRSSVITPRGLGMDQGLDILAQVRQRLALPVTTDIHESDQAARAASVVDMLQIPAFLCRQTDLLVAAGQTGLPVNIKKGQFMAPAEMANAVEKVRSTGNQNILLTERGTFFGYNRLVNDFTAIPQMQALGTETRNSKLETRNFGGGKLGTPVLMDATHSTQLPGGLGTATAGQRQFVPLLARAAVAVGANGLFIETHPTPEKSPSDAATILHLADLPHLLEQCLAIREAIHRQGKCIWSSEPRP